MKSLLASIVIAVFSLAFGYVAWQLFPLKDGSYAGKNMVGFIVALIGYVCGAMTAGRLFPCSLPLLHNCNTASEIGEVETCVDCGRKWLLYDKRYPAVGAGDYSPRYREIA